MSNKFGYNANGFVRYSDSLFEGPNVANTLANANITLLDYQEDFANIVTAIGTMTLAIQSGIANVVVKMEEANTIAANIASNLAALKNKAVDETGIRVISPYDQVSAALLDKTLVDEGFLEDVTKYVQTPLFPLFANANIA